MASIINVFLNLFNVLKRKINIVSTDNTQLNDDFNYNHLSDSNIKNSCSDSGNTEKNVNSDDYEGDISSFDQLSNQEIEKKQSISTKILRRNDEISDINNLFYQDLFYFENSRLKNTKVIKKIFSTKDLKINLYDKKNLNEGDKIIDILKTLQIKENEVKKTINLPITINILSERGKQIKIEDLNLEKSIFNENTINDSYFVFKVLLKSQARKNMFSCNLLIQHIDDFLNNSDNILDDPVCEENQFYKITVFKKNLKLSDLIKSEYNCCSTRNSKSKIKPIIQYFNLLIIIPMPIYITGIESILRNIKTNLYFTKKTSCFIVGINKYDGYDYYIRDTETQRFVDENNVDMEKTFLKSDFHFTKLLLKPLKFESIVENEIRKTEIENNKTDFMLPECENLQFKIVTMYESKNNLAYFFYKYERVNLEFNTDYNFVVLKGKNGNFSENEKYHFILDSFSCTRYYDLKNNLRTISFCISDCGTNRYSKDYVEGRYLNFQKYEYDHNIVIVFKLEWFLNKTTNDFSVKNSKENLEYYKMYLIFLDNMNALTAYYGKLIFSEKINSFEILFNDYLNFLTRETSYFHSNLDLINLTNEHVIFYTLEFLDFEKTKKYFEVYTYDVDETKYNEEGQRTNSSEFLINLIPCIEEHDLYKNELNKYTNFKKVSKITMNETLKQDKGLFLEMKISERKVIYITLRPIHGSLLEIDTHEDIFLENIFDQLSRCLSKRLIYRYCQYDIRFIKQFLDLKYKMWKIILNLKNLLGSSFKLPTSTRFNLYIRSIFEPIKFSRILYDDLKKDSVKSLAEISFAKYFDFDNLNAEFEIYKKEICEIVDREYTKVLNQKTEYKGLFFSYFYRTSVIEDDFLDQKRSFLV